MVKLMGYYQLPGSMPVQVSFEDLPEENMDAHVVKKYKIQQLEGNAGCGY